MSIAIADQSGHVLASTTVAAMPRPLIGNAATIMPAQVVAAAGAAYYSDPQGRVHRMGATGSDAVVATFPLSNTQQELSFAVSPDGKQVMATVLSTPPLHNPPPRELGDPLYQPGAPWILETFLAPAGGAATSIARRTADQPQYPSVTRIVGWDAGGPLALLQACVGAQDVPASIRYCGTSLVHLGLDGTHLDQVGGSSCQPLDVSAAGVLCYAGHDLRSYEVRSFSGALLWTQQLPASEYLYNPALSPDGRRIAVLDRVYTRDAPAASLPRQVVPQSVPAQVRWVTNDTIASTGDDGKLGLVPAADLQHPLATGISGYLVGTI